MRPNIILHGHKRKGRGFTRKELEKAVLSFYQARLLGIVIDRRRKTTHAENVKVLEYLKEQARIGVAGHKEKKVQGEAIRPPALRGG